MGSAVDEKKGAKATIPLTLTRVSVIALKKIVHSGILSSRLPTAASDSSPAPLLRPALPGLLLKAESRSSAQITAEVG
jgi:hypothetical protein